MLNTNSQRAWESEPRRATLREQSVPERSQYTEVPTLLSSVLRKTPLECSYLLILKGRKVPEALKDERLPSTYVHPRTQSSPQHWAPQLCRHEGNQLSPSSVKHEPGCPLMRWMKRMGCVHTYYGYNMVPLMCRGSVCNTCLRPGGNKAVTDDHERRKRYREVCGQDGWTQMRTGNQRD